MIKLNKEQQEAVESNAQFNLIIAGAGTGKTTVIINRIIKLIYDENLSPESLALLTFSNKAASEMKERVENSGVSLYYASTFHSFALKIIGEFQLLGYSPDILEGDEKIEFFKESIQSLQLKPNYIEPFLEQIERLKRNGLFHEELMINPQNQLEVFLKKAYFLYEKALIEKQRIDYEGMLLTVIQHLKTNPNFQHVFKNKFTHILIDEYQDSSLLQLNLIREILALNPKIHLFAVGDDDQSIYGFRDAKIENILNFETYFKGTKIIKLLENYRSTEAIIDIANQLIKNNKFRYKKTLSNIKPLQGILQKKIFLNEKEEANYLLKTIEKLLEQKEIPNTIALLFRYNYQIKNLAPYLKEKGVIFSTSLTDEEKIELDLDNHGEGIQLMTYHHAKGLEFKTVFLPYLGDEVFLRKDSDIEEERRLFYVGITRAKENLFLSYATANKKFGQFLYTKPLRFLDEFAIH